MPIKSAASVPGSSSSNTVQLGKGTKSTPSTGKKRKRKNDSMIEDEIGTTFAIEVAEYNIRNIRAEHGTEADKDTEKKVRTKTHEVAAGEVHLTPPSWLALNEGKVMSSGWLKGFRSSPLAR